MHCALKAAKSHQTFYKIIIGRFSTETGISVRKRFMGNEFFFNWEPALMEGIQSHLNSFGVTVASALSTLGSEYAMIALLCFLYFYWDKNAGKSVARRLLPAMVLKSEFKNIFCRLRPYFVHKNVAILQPVDPSADIYDVAAQGYSFPSGHSVNIASSLGATALFFKKKWITIVCTCVIVLVGCSRFFVGAHYPTDVLAGWALGAAVVFGYSFLEKKIKDIRIIYLILLLIGLPGFFYSTTNDYFTEYGMLIGFVFGDLFEDKFVKFKSTRNPIRGIIRVAIGGGLYFALNTILKLPFSSSFLASGTTLAFLVRTIRYAVIIFLIMGVYPKAFAVTDKILARKNTKQ